MSRLDASSGAAPRAVVGLGNPGSRYEGTRHNVGFEVVDRLAERRSLRLDREECNALVAVGDDLLLVKPMTYMNRSGYALRCLVERRGLEPDGVLVVYDEVHLPLGRLRMRRGGEPAGHRGLESIVNNLRTTDVPRLRLGVGPPEAAVDAAGLSDFVLGAFSTHERELADEMVERAADAVESWLEVGVEQTMNVFNRAVVESN